MCIGREGHRVTSVLQMSAPSLSDDKPHTLCGGLGKGGGSLEE